MKCVQFRNNSKRDRVGGGGFLLLLIFMLFVSCSTVPITGREQLNLIPSETLLKMSFSEYSDFLAGHKVIENTPQAAMVTRVGRNIALAVDRYMAEHNMSDRLREYSWEFHLIDDKEINAWAMPGGKVAVYSGILPVAEDDTGLAVVLGHEISHAVANHGEERMSQALLAQMGGMALATALSQKPKETTNLFLAAYGLGAQVGILLPYSRLQESEADRLGLIFMAMAGYDPHAAVPFWERMLAAQKGPEAPVFLSTHPADQARIENIKKLIPEAMTYFRK